MPPVRLIDGRDPKIEREAVRACRQGPGRKACPTFAAAADADCEAHKTGWRTKKHAREVRETLRTLAEPVLGALAVDAVDTTLVLKFLQPILAVKPDAATRLRAAGPKRRLIMRGRGAGATAKTRRAGRGISIDRDPDSDLSGGQAAPGAALC